MGRRREAGPVWLGEVWAGESGSVQSGSAIVGYGKGERGMAVCAWRGRVTVGYRWFGKARPAGFGHAMSSRVQPRTGVGRGGLPGHGWNGLVSGVRSGKRRVWCGSHGGEMRQSRACHGRARPVCRSEVGSGGLRAWCGRGWPGSAAEAGPQPGLVRTGRRGWSGLACQGRRSRAWRGRGLVRLAWQGQGSARRGLVGRFGLVGRGRCGMARRERPWVVVVGIARSRRGRPGVAFRG